MIKIAKKIPRYKKWISSSKGGVMFISPEWSKVMLWLPYPGATIPDPVLPPDQKKIIGMVKPLSSSLNYNYLII